jgi:hypothetical protein
MPDITYSIQVSVNRDPVNQVFAAAGVTSDMSTTGILAATLNLTTATSAFVTASASTLGLCYARSLVTSSAQTATVSFGRLDGTTLHEVVRLRPGDAALFRLAPGNYAAKAAATGRIMLQVIED